MDIHKAIAILTRSAIFKEWHEKNKEFFLAHAFLMLDEANKDTWQIGFYHPEKQRMVTFILTGTSVQHTEEQEVMRSEAEIKLLQIENVKITVDDALKEAKNCFTENYKGEMPLKEFFIIQNAEGHTIFNITYFTQSLKTINIKINAADGKILKHDRQSLAEFA